MASILSNVGAGLCYSRSAPCEGWKRGRGSVVPRRFVMVRAEGGGSINPDIRKSEKKVVDSVVVTELAKPLTPYCRFVLFLFDSLSPFLCVEVLQFLHCVGNMYKNTQ